MLTALKCNKRDMLHATECMAWQETRRPTLSFTEGMSYEEFAHDRRTQLSVLKSVEIVGEAAAHVSEDTKRAHPAIPWRDIVGMRNRLVHAYFDIDLPVVWGTVCDDLPALIARLEPLIPPEAG